METPLTATHHASNGDWPYRSGLTNNVLFRLICQPIEDRLKLQASRLKRGFIGFARDPERISVEK